MMVGTKKIEMSQDEQKEVMLQILVDFAEYCEAHNLQYFLDAGTLIGAVRHDGYIPWDDDIDVCMPRVDYDRFMTLMKENNDYLNEHLIVERPEDIMYPFPKLADTRTILVEHPNTYPTEVCVYIDIFPKDYVKDDGIGSRIVCDLCEGFEWLQWINNYSIHAWKKSNNLLKKVVAYILSPFIKNPNYGVALEERLIRNHNKHMIPEKCKYVTSLVRGEFKKRTPKECFESCEMHMFEGHMFRIPVGYDKYLRTLYKGDYMQLPPEEKRINHRTIVYWKSEQCREDFISETKRKNKC